MSGQILPTVIEIDGLCSMLSIGKNTAYNLLTNGKIDCFKVGSVWKIPIAAVNQYIEDQCRSTTKKSTKKHKLYRLIKKDQDLAYEREVLCL